PQETPYDRQNRFVKRHPITPAPRATRIAVTASSCVRLVGRAAIPARHQIYFDAPRRGQSRSLDRTPLYVHCSRAITIRQVRILRLAVLLNALLAQHSQFGQRHAKIRTRGFGHAERNGAVSSSRMATITDRKSGAEG